MDNAKIVVLLQYINFSQGRWVTYDGQLDCTNLSVRLPYMCIDDLI